MSRAILYAPISAAILLSSAAYAQDTVATSAPARPAEGEPAAAAEGGTADIVVTAQRRAERLKDVPITVTALSSEELGRAGVTSVRDLATLVSGFTFSGLGTVAQPAIRGVSTSISASGSENPNAVYLDGIYQVSQSALSGDLPDVERIEVLKGPQGTLFGRNATGGAIQVFTRGPSFTPSASINIEEGLYTGSGSSRSANHFNVRAFGTVPLVDDVVAISVAGGSARNEGFATNDLNGRRFGLYSNQLVRGKLLVKPSSDFSILATGYYVKNRNDQGLAQQPVNGLTSAQGLPGAVIPTEKWHVAFNSDSFAGPLDGQPAESRFRQWGTSLKLQYDADIGTLTSLTGYTNTRSVNPLTAVHGAFCPATAFLTFQCLVSAFTTTTRETSQELNFASRDFGAVSFTTGAFYYHGRGNTINTLQFGIPANLTRYNTKSYAGYGEATIKPTEELSLIAGIRYSHETQRDFNFLSATPAAPFTATRNKWTPRVSVRYALTPDLNVYATYSQGYKTGLTGATNQGLQIAPEKLTAYEAGVKFGSNQLSFNAAFFYYDYKDQQVQGFDGVNSNIRNADARLYGVDADVNWIISDSLRFRATGSWLPHAKYTRFTDASYATPIRNPASGLFYQNTAIGFPGAALFPVDVTGSRLVKAPKYTASATLTFEQPVAGGRFDASATGAYSSAFDQELSRTLHQDGYATLAVNLGFRPGDGPLRVGVYGRNITNKAYQANALSSGYGFLTSYAPPREVGAVVGYTF